MENPFQGLPEVSLSIGKPVLWGFFVLFFIGYSIISGVLVYHWKKYGMSNKTIIFAQGLFIVVSIILFAITFGALSLI